jgi:hypothetical protein
MIYKGKNEIVSIKKGKKVIQIIYKGALVIWQAIRSCFGSGFWVNEKPWYNDESWKNN